MNRRKVRTKNSLMKVRNNQKTYIFIPNFKKIYNIIKIQKIHDCFVSGIIGILFQNYSTHGIILE